MLLILLALFLLPIVARAALIAFENRAPNWQAADWSSIGSLPPATSHPAARILVLSARTGRWKGIFATHSWVVLKRENARSWSRYDVVGWGNPVRINGWAPDGRWFGDNPVVVADVSGAEAAALIPRIEAAIKSYAFARSGDYRVWPGPNSNTFVAAVLRAVPELAATLPPTAVGKDFRPGPFIGLTDSGTGVEASLWGLLGVKAGWVEGLEINLLGLVAGLDLRQPGLKLPAFGHLGLAGATALAGPTPDAGPTAIPAERRRAREPGPT
ncbi:MAG: DUF3750 domain-containing protein [Xanthobacteraceae bacterium]